MTTVQKQKIEGSCSLNLNKDCSGRRRAERTHEDINVPQEKLIENPRISAEKNSLGIGN